MNTPRYIVDLDKYYDNCSQIEKPFTLMWGNNVEFGYSVKTNRDPKLISYSNSYLHWNIEVVSPDEFDYCKKLGILEDNIILNGPCKINLLKNLKTLPKIINLDNCKEVDEFISLFPNYNGLVGLRVNFDLENKCPGETTAGEEVSRFGIDVSNNDFDSCLSKLVNNGINNIGLHLHNSTKTRSLNVFLQIAQEANNLKEKYRFNFSFIDIGGGFFGGQNVPGKPTMQEYANTICNKLKETYDPDRTKLILEPGASVLATCVTYETTIINKRDIRGVAILTVDGSVLHINPFMAKRNQPFELVKKKKDTNLLKKQIICGATCMENDRLSTLINYPELQENDVLSFKNVGAYTMAFNSFFILNPPNVIYKGEKTE